MRFDEQILPFNAWLPVGKGNLLLDLHRLQKNPIFCISVDILQNTNFFRAFTASANWFTLNADLLRKALEITPEDSARPFVSPPAAIQIFFAHRASLNVPTKKPTPHIISYCWFTKLIIFYLGSEHNIHRRPGSPVHITRDNFLLGNLKFVPKGEKDEKKTSSKADKPTPVKKHATTKQTKPVKEKSTKPAPSTKDNKGKVLKVQKGKRSERLVDEEEEPQPAHEPQIEDDEYNLQRGIQMSLESFQAPVGRVAIREPTLGVTRSLLLVEGKGKGIATGEQAAQSLLELQQPKKKSTTDQYIFQRRTPVTGEESTGPSARSQDDTFANVVVILQIPNVDEERGENVSNTMALEEETVEHDKGQARSDPGNTLESRAPPDKDQAGPNPRQSHVALAEPNPEPIHEDFSATVYLKVHEILKHTTEEHVLLENPPSSSGTLLSMKNLDDALPLVINSLMTNQLKKD
ncbi:hypothetical protein Tco_1540969 [Tanacetum coccineum]